VGRGSGHAGLIRGSLVTLQFAILITLAIAGAVMWLQRDFAARQALRADGSQMLLVKLGAVFPTVQIQASQKERAELRSQPMPLRTRFCPPGFIDEVRKLPGVQGAICTDDQIIGARARAIAWQPSPATIDSMDGYPVDPRIFALYGVKPLAGTLPGAGAGDETIRQTGTVINLTAMRKLGFASPRAALGQNWITAVKMMGPDQRQFYADEYGAHAVITAVVPDFSFGSVRDEIPPTIYSPWADAFGRMVHVKLRGGNIPETLAAIDRLYTRSGIDAPLDRAFVNEHMRALYRDVTRDTNFFAACAAIAIILACMGLVGIAIATAERRTKEIGVRKVMGATTARIVGLLLWRFSLPVLLANVIAWPVAYWLMQRWLAGFAYRIELHWWIFAAASGVALLLALLTVAGQAIRTARQKPVLALRYE
jgi:putative ABC transport system permease protein